MLNYLNNKFINLSFKTKIELYILPLMLLYLADYSYTYLSNNKINEIKTSININQFDNKKFDGSFLELFNEIEKNAQDLNIQVNSLNNKKNIIDLKISAKVEDLVKLINRIENINNFTKISIINIYDKNEVGFYLIDIAIDLNKFYLKTIDKIEKKIVVENKKELLENTEIKTIDVKEKTTYELKAIISDFILVNETWIKKGENLDDFKLIEINKDHVILESKNNKENLKLELANEQYLKNIY